MLPLFGGYVFECPNTGGNGDRPKIPYKTRHFSIFCVTSLVVKTCTCSTQNSRCPSFRPKVPETRDMLNVKNSQNVDHRVGRRLFIYIYIYIPCPSFPCFLECEEFLVFSNVFPFFSRDFRGSVGIKNPCFFGGFPCLFPKNKERKDRVYTYAGRPDVGPR